MKTAFICPFNLERLTGTPIRAKTTISAAASFSDTYVIATSVLYFDKVKSIYPLGPANLLQFAKKAIAILKIIKPDTVHGFTTVSVFPALIYKCFFNHRVKIVFESHGWGWFESKGQLPFLKRFLFLTMDICGLWFSDAVIAMSFSQQNFLSKISSSKKIRVCWGPVDFDIVFDSVPKRNYVKFGYIGNFSFWQGLSNIIKAARILENNAIIKFELAGFDFSDTKHFPRLKNILYKGKVERKDVPSFIKSCDIMLSPRIKGGVSDLQYPHKLSEYLSSGRGVIASDVSDQRLVVEQANAGIVLDELTGESLARAVQRVAEMSYAERNQFGRNAVDFANKNFSFQVYTEKLREVYGAL